MPAKRAMGRRIFVVHGHDHEFLDEVEQALLRMRLDPVILRDEANHGRTLIEKLEECAASVDLALVLFTPDDVLYTLDAREGFWSDRVYTPREEHARVRNNVMLELGFFLGRLGRSRVVVLRKEHDSWDLPSDMNGVAYLSAAEPRWKQRLAAEIHRKGIQIEPGHVPA